MSIEVDVLPIAADNEQTAHLADLIEGVAAELSSFQQLHDYSIDGVDLNTSALPDGWRERLVRVQNENTAAPSGQPQLPAGAWTRKTPVSPSSARCAKRIRPSARRYWTRGLVDRAVIADWLTFLPPRFAANAGRAAQWLARRAESWPPGPGV